MSSRTTFTLLFAAFALAFSGLACEPKGKDKTGGESTKAASGPQKTVDTGPALEAIKKEHASAGTTPEGALRLWLREAALYHKQPEISRATLRYLTIPFKEQAEWHKLNSTRTFVERLETKPYIFQSYAKGSAPTNAYAFDPKTFELDVTKSEIDPHGDRGHAVHIRSTGADSPRPVYLKKSSQSGLYYVSNFNNTYVDIRKPIDPNKETFE